MDRMGIVLDLLGVEEGKEYKIYDKDDNEINSAFYLRRDKGLVCINEYRVVNYTKLIRGEHIIKKLGIRLTDGEKAILRNLEEGYEWIARDKDGTLYCYVDKPNRNTLDWNGHFIPLSAFKHIFQSIQWENEEPYLIEDLLRR